MGRLKIYLISFGFWFILMTAGFLNGTVRTFFIEPYLNYTTAHAISTITLLCAITMLTYIFFRAIAMYCAKKKLLFIGLIWFIMVILFEFAFGHFVMGIEWNTLLADYNIFKGRIWILIPVSLLISPYLWGTYFRKKKNNRDC